MSVYYTISNARNSFNYIDTSVNVGGSFVRCSEGNEFILKIGDAPSTNIDGVHFPPQVKSVTYNDGSKTFNVSLTDFSNNDYYKNVKLREVAKDKSKVTIQEMLAMMHLILHFSMLLL